MDILWSRERGAGSRERAFRFAHERVYLSGAAADRSVSAPERVRRKSFLPKKANRIASTRTTSTGARRASTAVRIEPPNSAVANKGLANPPVPAEEAPRARTVVPWTRPATPPPAMMAKAHQRKGLVPVTSEAVTKVPATRAARA